MLGKLLNAAGSRWDKLSVIDKLLDNSTNINKMCYNHVLGVCALWYCKFQHVGAADIPVAFDFATTTCLMCSSVIDYLLHNKEPSLGGDVMGAKGGKAIREEETTVAAVARKEGTTRDDSWISMVVPVNVVLWIGTKWQQQWRE